MKQFFRQGLLIFLLKLIRVYQRFISPSLAARCRYYPTCSAYAYQALTWQGLGRGGYLAACRICRCHPWGGSGVDFVPVPLWRYTYTPSHRHWEWVYVCSCDYRMRLNVLLQHSLRKSGQKVVRTTSLL